MLTKAAIFRAFEQMGPSNYSVLVFLSWLLFACSTHQLNSYETQVLLQLRKHLEYPLPLSTWENNNADFCNLSSPPQLTIKCENDSVTELRIMGDKPAKVSSEFNGFAIPNLTLSQSFSMDSFITTLTRLSNLRVVTLVSLGVWGPLPDKIHRLYLLEALDMSSNFLFGPIPSQMSRMVKLRTLSFDENYFNGSVPEWLDSWSNLTVLSLKNNRLNGEIPSAVSRIATLIELVMSHNLLTGKLPDLSSLSSLQLLDLRENGLDSELPPLPKGLANVFLSKNSFSGGIPEQFVKLDQLQHLDLSNNHLSGTPPPLLFSLPNISYLNLSSNVLSGLLPEHLKCGEGLSLIDLSDNKMVGHLPNCLDTAADNRIVKISGNCFSADARDQHSAAYCKDVEGKGRSRTREIVILAGVIGGIVVVVIILLLVGLMFFCKRHQTQHSVVQHIAPKVKQDEPPSGISPDLITSARIMSEASKVGNQSSPSYRVFTVAELEEATKNFDQSTFLGEGSFGKVYKGKLENGSFVVIRSLTLYRKCSIQNLKLRLDLLSKLRHPHLVALLGHCIDDGMQDDSSVRRLYLVQEFVPDGNFRSHLSENSPEKVMKWPERLAVLIGAAKAVHFLHTGVIPPSLSNRLKTNNILMDEHGIAKLSDYGMSIIADETEKSDGKGEHVDRLQDDVHNFGFILLESLVGPVTSGKGEAFLLNEMTSFSSQDGRRKIVDPIVLTTSSQESLSIVISITNKCISGESSGRPSFEDVLWNLQYAAQVQATADADQKSDSASHQSFG
ncbi:probable inactive leucine-rich repeat receptor-like protein kinase At3g03770 isoform X1 [Salvia hispanica]|uniref:probable inactive leucine-rich repeat receptor-like protein kinase At3g03770 isoform X1 n=1 Tax=Salvia hispanica TaxID=49212 RepID=UPI0020090B07|nr:probable inactive leucine-rich repeat receptor-like protein kinase At3g03770 isoform X1 [Salvia hispanica]